MSAEPRGAAAAAVMRCGLVLSSGGGGGGGQHAAGGRTARSAQPQWQPAAPLTSWGVLLVDTESGGSRGEAQSLGDRSDANKQQRRGRMSDLTTETIWINIKRMDVKR